MCIGQLEAELRAVAEMTEVELESLRSEVLEHCSMKAGIEDVHKVHKFLQSIQPKIGQVCSDVEALDGRIQALDSDSGLKDIKKDMELLEAKNKEAVLYHYVSIWGLLC